MPSEPLRPLSAAKARAMLVALAVQGVVWIWAASYLSVRGWPTFGEGIVNPYASHLAFHSITYPAATMVTPLLFSLLTGGGVTRKTLLGLFDAFPNIILSLPVVALGFKAFLEGWIGDVVFTSDRSIGALLGQVALYLVLVDLAFYLSHRALHLQPLYRFHATHHTHKAPTEAMAFFAVSAAETYASGLVPLFFPVLFMQIHVLAWIAGTSLILFFGCFIHDRGSLARSPRTIFNGPAEHQIHHRRGRKNANFGLIFTTWDRVFGTYTDPRGE